MSKRAPRARRPQFLAPYSGYHMRVRKARGAARLYPCDGGCGGQAMDWAIIHGEDAAKVESYRPLCRKCHYRYDAETQQQGPVKRSLNPSWQASRAAIPRDSAGRYTHV
jgi:hypothetical protein